MEIPELIALLQAKIKIKVEYFSKEETRVALEKHSFMNEIQLLRQLLKDINETKSE